LREQAGNRADSKNKTAGHQNVLGKFH
jgi:hypothetical protein